MCICCEFFFKKSGRHDTHLATTPTGLGSQICMTCMSGAKQTRVLQFQTRCYSVHNVSSDGRRLHHPLEPRVEIPSTVGSVYDPMVDIATLRTTSSSAKPAVIGSFTPCLFLRWFCLQIELFLWCTHYVTVVLHVPSSFHPAKVVDCLPMSVDHHKVQ